MEVDFAEVSDENHDYACVPSGTYAVRVEEVRGGNTRDGSERWGLRLVVTEGDYAGKLCAWDALVWSDRGLPRAKRILTALGFDATGTVNVEPQDLVGHRARVQVVVEDWESPETGAIITRNAVPYQGWAPLNGTQGAVDAEEGRREALAHDSPF